MARQRLRSATHGAGPRAGRPARRHSWRRSGFAPDAVITSPLARARQTAELVEPLGANAGCASTSRLGERLSLDVIERILRDAGDPTRPVLVGHDPDFSDMLGLLVGAVQVPMRKGTIARIDIARPLTPSTGILRWLVPPELFERHKRHH